jgi:hypothetical protein
MFMVGFNKTNAFIGKWLLGCGDKAFLLMKINKK